MMHNLKLNTVNSGYKVHVPITLSGKKYALNKVYVLNKQVSKYMVMPNNTSILSFVLTGYGFMLPCMCFVHLALLDHSTPDYARDGQSHCCMVLKSHIQIASIFVFL